MLVFLDNEIKKSKMSIRNSMMFKKTTPKKKEENNSMVSCQTNLELDKQENKELIDLDNKLTDESVVDESETEFQENDEPPYRLSIPGKYYQINNE